jgi:hypothetical protein
MATTDIQPVYKTRPSADGSKVDVVEFTGAVVCTCNDIHKATMIIRALERQRALDYLGRF